MYMYMYLHVCYLSSSVAKCHANDRYLDWFKQLNTTETKQSQEDS